MTQTIHSLNSSLSHASSHASSHSSSHAQKHILSWQQLLEKETSQPYFHDLMKQIDNERACGKSIYPNPSDVFRAFELTPFDDVKVVVLGQDPYHGKNQATGLAFSVPRGEKIPPSLRNIFKALSQDIEGFIPPNHGDLTHWATQGVLLLNTVLTVEHGLANSHASFGWETYTDAVIDALNTHHHGLVFLLWGAHAQKKGQSISDKHLVLKAPHPSPLSAHRGFFNCQHFSKTNDWLCKNKQNKIDWFINN